MTNAIISTTDSSIAAVESDSSAVKRLKYSDHFHQNQSLLPGLPDHVAQLCLSLVHPSLLYNVCSSWRQLIYSPTFPPFLSLYTLLISTQTSSRTEYPYPVEFASFDPISSRWHSVPSPLLDPSPRIILRHPSFLSFNIPIQSISVSGHLVLLAATTDQFLPALPRPLIFSPLNKEWFFGPLLTVPRRWCAAGVLCHTVYVASGIGSQYNPEVARSLEKWNLKGNRRSRSERKRRNFGKGWKWEKMRGLRDGRFSREAIEAVGWRGKLYMVNVKGRAAKYGVIYDVQNDEWEEMPGGMLSGWRGPAASMEEEAMFVVDESTGVLKRYDPETDQWVEVFESERMRGAQHMSAGGGRVCVVCGGGIDIAVVDVVATPPRFWVVETPPGFEAVATHILPRMPQPDFPAPVPA